MLQLYEKSRYGMVPFGLPVNAEKWTLEEEIKQFKYDEKTHWDILSILINLYMFVSIELLLEPR